MSFAPLGTDDPAPIPDPFARDLLRSLLSAFVAAAAGSLASGIVAEVFERRRAARAAKAEKDGAS